MNKTSPLLKLLFLFLSFVFIGGCSNVTVEEDSTFVKNDRPAQSEQKTQESTDNSDESMKSARDVVTAGDDQQVLEGKPVVLSASRLSKEKNFVSFIWKENGEILSQNMEFTLENLSVGVHEITLEATDENGVVYVDTVTVTIKKRDSSNSIPVAKTLHFSIDEDTVLNTSLQGSDDDGDFLKYLLVSLPTHGVLSGSAAHLSYKPDKDFYGEEKFYFKVNDGKIDSDVATVTIVVEARNDAPLAYDLSYETKEDQSVDIKLKGDDIDGDDLSFRLLKAPSFGSVAINDDIVTYTPENNFNGIDTFEYVVSDFILESEAATVRIDVKAVNDIPVVFDRVFSTDEDQPIDITLEGMDDEGHELTYELVSKTKLGNAKITANVLHYTPYPNVSGVERIEYVASDSISKSLPATVTITINAKNDAPSAKDILVTTDEDIPKSFYLSAEDADGDALTYTIVKAAKNGTVKIDANALVTYTPNRYFNGNDSFSYIASDLKEDSNIAEVNIVVNSVNNPPQAYSQTLSVYQNSRLHIDLEASDIENDLLRFYNTSPSHGVLTGVSPNLIYTPDVNFTGEDSFFYWVNDTFDNSQKKKITINVLQTPNTKPIADNKIVVMNEDENKTVTLSAYDAEQTELFFSIKQEPSNGTVTLNGNKVVYTPFENFNGNDSFTYIANDSLADSDVATVSITVNAVNDMPVANAQILSTNEDTNLSITLLGSDIDGTIVGYEITTNPQNAVLNCDFNSCIYTPSKDYFGNDFFEYTASDGNLSSQPARVNITVVSQNDLPVAYDKDIELNEDENITFLLEAFDVENDIRSYDIITSPSNGTLLQDMNSVTYIPNENYNGNDLFTFVVKDSQSESQSATVNISVISVNDSPTAVGKSLSLDEDSYLDINLTAFDADDTNLTFSLSKEPSNGKLEGVAPYLRYIPNKDFFGEDNFTFVAQDSHGDTDEANMTIFVNPLNDPPVANAGGDVTVFFGSNVRLSAENSVDIDDVNLFYEWKEGTVLLGEGVVLDKSDFSLGVHEVTLTVSDDHGAKSSDTVIVTVNEEGSLVPYVPHVVTTAATDAQWLEMDDLDSDGDLDIASVSKNGVAWYENLGGFLFKEHNISDITTANFIKIADLDNNGYKEIVFSSATNGYALNVCLNDTNKTFDCNAISTTTSDISSFTLADMNNDQNIDIVTASFTNNNIDWIKNVGNAVFNGPYTIDDQNIVNPVFVDVSDFNNDGNIDIVAASGTNNDIYWYENIDKASSFTARFQDNSIQSIGSVTAADINGDGYDDIISVSKEDGAVYWHPSLGGDTPSVTFSMPLNIVSSLTGVIYAGGVDMDGDGDLDILTNSSKSGGEIAWYDNNGTREGFASRLVVSGVNNVSRVYGADMDNDTNMDVVSADLSGNIVIYENNASILPLPKTGDKTALSADDDGTLQMGVDYIYRRDDLNEIVLDTTSGLVWQDDVNVTNSINWNEANEYCAALDMGGYSDWRLPNIHELYFLLDRSKTSSTIKDGFVNVVNSGYWSSTKVQSTFFTDYEYYALWVGFYDNRSDKDILFSSKYVRCVRGDEFVVHLDRDAAKEIVTDAEHKLQWQDNADVESNSVHWIGAISYCKNLNLDGGGWRVPNVNELYSLTSGAGWNNAFSYGASSLYWSSTGNGEITTVDFEQGHDNNRPQDDTIYVRCVRSLGQR